MNNTPVQHKNDEQNQVVEKIDHIDARLEAMMDLGSSAIDAYKHNSRSKTLMERQVKRLEINADLKRHEKEQDIDNEKHKRVTYLLYFSGGSIVALCMVAFFTGNAEHVKTILMAVGFLLGGPTISKAFKSKSEQ